MRSIQDVLFGVAESRAQVLRRRQFDAAHSDPDHKVRPWLATTVVYVLCVAYWVLVVGLAWLLLSSWGWSHVVFTRVVMTALGVAVVVVSWPSDQRRRKALRHVTWTTDERWLTTLTHWCDAVDGRRVRRVGFTLGWVSGRLRGATRDHGSLLIGAPMWVALTPDLRAAALTISLTAMRAGRLNDVLVRLTTRSLDGWMHVCNFDPPSLSAPWGRGISWTTTLGGGAGVGIVAEVRMASWLSDMLLALIGLVPATVRLTLALADVPTNQAAVFEGVRKSIELFGNATTLAALDATDHYERVDTAMQRHVLGGGREPLSAAAEVGRTEFATAQDFGLARTAQEFAATLAADAYASRYALALGYTAANAGGLDAELALDLPPDITTSINRDLVDRYRS